MNELSVRRILTPDQLVRFRDMRQKFNEQTRENLQKTRLLKAGVSLTVKQPSTTGKNFSEVKVSSLKQAVRPNKQRPNL